MRNIDTETEEYINPSPDEAVRRRPRTTSSKTLKGNRPAKRPTPDPDGPAPRRAPKRRESQGYNFISFLRDYRTHLAVGIFLCLAALVMAGCGISYLFNNTADQSVIHGRSVAEIVNSGDTVENAGGVIGAKLAELLMVSTFGIGSFVLSFYIFVIGLTVIRVYKVHFFAFTFRCLFTTAALSIIVGLISYSRDAVFNLGGNHGQYINALIFKYSDALGAYAVSFLLAGLLIAVFLHPLRRFFSMLGKVMRRRPAVADDAASVNAADSTDATVAASLDNLETEEDDGQNIIPVSIDTIDAEENDEEEDSGETDETEASGLPEGSGTAALPDIPEEHLAYLPKVGLDDFENKDDDDEDFDEFDNHSTPESGTVTAEERPGTTTRRIESASGEPELVIVNHQPETVDENTRNAIRNGDHIGIDTPYDVRASHSNYVFPPTDLLAERTNTVEINEAEQLANKNLIVEALRSYNIEIQRIEATVGPTVTLYEIVPAQGTRIAKIKSLEDDIAMSLSALGIRIIAPIPGKGTVGIEVPNRKPQIVSMRKVLESKTFANSKMHLPMALGATISNEIFMADLIKMPHMLVAGATGQGKSVGLNCIIASLLYSKHPDELKFVLVDPKTVEFSLFETISHQYLAKLPDEEKAVITDPKKVVDTLNSLCVEMDQRYELLSRARVRTLEDYNERFTKRMLNPQDGHKYLPYIVVIVDEYADLVMVAGKEVAAPVCRIAQKARAVGIHMILATQRPSTDIITGMIKANFPARIAFKVTQGVDSKTILDQTGAQRLIGRGDMLTQIGGILTRVQCAFIDTPEVEAICEHIGRQPGFTGCYLLPDPPTGDSDDSAPAEYGAVTEEFKRCALFISSQSQASITSLQRKFEIGFNKAGRFMDQMQQMGIVGPAKGAKPRDVLMTPDEVQRLFE